jgi:hypothetical protein
MRIPEGLPNSSVVKATISAKLKASPAFGEFAIDTRPLGEYLFAGECPVLGDLRDFALPEAVGVTKGVRRR